ncbi:MAG: SDR family NAD(P)-dependent oxidoreductase [Mycobacterium sp.]
MAPSRYTVDVSDRSQVRAAVDRVRTDLGPVLMLINNAGIEQFGKFTEITEITDEQWDLVMAVNLREPFKQGVLDAALARYEDGMSGIIADLESPRRGLPDIERFVRRVRAVLEDPNSPRGCFMVNTMVEVGDGIPEVQQRVAAYRRRIERALNGALELAEADGDIEPGSSQDRARLIQAALFGAFAASRAGDDAAAARAGLHAISRELRRWSAAVRG